MRKTAIIDLSSVIWTALMAGRDDEFGYWVKLGGDAPVRITRTEAEALPNKEKAHINSAAYGYENAVSHLVAVMEQISVVPRQMLFVVEGKNSKAERQALHPGYKAGRDKVDDHYVQFNECKRMLLDAFCSVGARAVWQDGGVEADDVIGYLAKHLRGERWIVSYDKDLAQCVAPDVHHLRNGTVDANPFGDFPHHLIPVCIALVGDQSDKIPHPKGFGEVSFKKLHIIWGDAGLVEMERLIRERKLIELQDDVGKLKELQRVIDDAENAYLGYELGRLRTHRVNTLKRPLQWRVGMVKQASADIDERLRKYAGTVRIVSAENYGKAREFFRRQMAWSPEVCLDLETYVGEESEEWLERRSKKGGGVDVLGSRITGVGLSFGVNGQHQMYLTTQHRDEPDVHNLTLNQVRDFLSEIPTKTLTIAHNAAGFELPVLFNHFGEDWKNNGWRGMFPNMVDSRIAATYWDEDQFSHGLKQLSKTVLDYEQESYQQVTSATYKAAEWGGTGKVLSRTPATEDAPETVTVEHRMNELTARHVLSYGIDDVRTTLSLWDFFRDVMEIEDTFDAFMRLEQKPMYLSALSYVQGVPISLERLQRLRKADDDLFAKHCKVLHEFLIARGWDGTVCPVYSELNAAAIKEIYQIVTGSELKTLVRTVSKLAKLIEEDHPLLSQLIAEGDLASINQLVADKFNGQPDFDVASPKQVARLLYEEMKLPVRMRNKATDTMREKGIFEGTPRTDDDAIRMAQKAGDVEAGSAEYEVLTALMEMKSINTKRGLYYEPYPAAVHWKTRRIHPELVQSGTNTRRWASRNPNIQQLDRDPEGVRSVILPHHRNAVVVSLDESGQEVRQAADYCRDPNLLSCFMGAADEIRDVHSIVGCRILGIPYRDLRVDDANNPLPANAGAVRNIAKIVLFASFYGAAAPKIAENLGISEEEAQGYIDAIYAQFPLLAEWKEQTELHAENRGWVPVHGGTVRHLRKQLLSENRYEQTKALRQASNARIQGAGSNQLKTIMSSIWDSTLIEDYDYRWYFPVHDETVHSVGRGDAVECLRILHGMMTAPFLELVPSASSIGFGRNFGALTEIGERFDEAAIRRALDDIFAPKEPAHAA